MSSAARPIPAQILAMYAPGEIVGEPHWDEAGDLVIPLADRDVVHTAAGADDAWRGVVDLLATAAREKHSRTAVQEAA
ncbi:MAG: hypothetical protein ACK47B_23590 [Armatimonadota bacterium]